MASASLGKPLPRQACHSCKTSHLPADLRCCTETIVPGKKRAQCRKKYCRRCLTRSAHVYGPMPSEATASDFTCPACRNLCVCAACDRKRRLVHYHATHAQVLGAFLQPMAATILKRTRPRLTIRCDLLRQAPPAPLSSIQVDADDDDDIDVDMDAPSPLSPLPPYERPATPPTLHQLLPLDMVWSPSEFFA
jgi:hypothetical protein